MSLGRDLPWPPKVLKTKVYSYLLCLPRVSHTIYVVPLHTDLGSIFLVLRGPRTCRRLLKEVFDCLKAGRLRNKPYCYTTGDVQAIASTSRALLSLSVSSKLIFNNFLPRVITRLSLSSMRLT
jgi:hypothetical protein